MSVKTRPHCGRGNEAMRVNAALVCVQVFFGMFHVCGKYVLSCMHPFALAGFRLLLAAPILMPVAYLIDRKIPTPRQMRSLFLLALLGVVANQIFFISGLKLTTATNASIIMLSTPIFTAAIGMIFGVEKQTPRRLAGIGLAVAGAFATLDFSNLGEGAQKAALLGNALLIINCVAYAGFLVLQRPLLRELPPLTIIAWTLLFGGIIIVALGASEMAKVDFAALPRAVVLGVIFIAVFPTIFAYALNSWAIGKSSPSTAAAFNTLQPIVSSVLAALLLGERAGLRQLFGFVLIFSGLALVISGRDVGLNRGCGGEKER